MYVNNLCKVCILFISTLNGAKMTEFHDNYKEQLQFLKNSTVEGIVSIGIKNKRRT